MSGIDLFPPRAEWPYLEVLIRLALALALGLLIGLERERRGKEAGLRTFGFIALFGALCGALGENFALLALVLTATLAILLNLHTMRSEQGTELTTSVVMLMTCTAGILCGQGHRLTPAATIVITTALLAWKHPLAGFSKGLSENELRSAVLLAILAIVVYPALPVGTLGPLGLIEPRTAWLTVLLIAGIGFVNYVLWKLYGARGVEFAGFLGGLVNSSVTVSELASRVKDGGEQAADTAYRGVILATAAMIIRNAALLAMLSLATFVASALPHVLMLAVCVGFAFARRQGVRTTEQPSVPEVSLELPFSLWVALKYGVVFLALNVIGVLAQHYAGHAGFFVVTFVGGMVSSASAVAAAASLAQNGTLPVAVAATGAIIASLTSVLVNLPFVARARNGPLMKKLVVAMTSIALVGLLAAVSAPLLSKTMQRIVPSSYGVPPQVGVAR